MKVDVLLDDIKGFTKIVANSNLHTATIIISESFSHNSFEQSSGHKYVRGKNIHTHVHAVIPERDCVFTFGYKDYLEGTSLGQSEIEEAIKTQRQRIRKELTDMAFSFIEGTLSTEA